MRFDNRLFLLLVLPGFFLALLVWGIAQLVSFSLMPKGSVELTNYAAFFARPDYVAMLWRTIIIAGLTALLSLLVGYPTAYFISRYQGRRDLLLLMIILPWLVSLVVKMFGLMVLLGNRGIINGLLMSLGLTSGPVPLMFNTVGVLIGMVHVFLPLMVIAILSVLLHMDRSLEEASMSLGAGPWTTFARVVLPLTLPGVMSGAILVYLIATGAIVTPLMLGAPRDALLGTQIYRNVMDIFDMPKASTVAIVLTVAAFLVVLPLQWLERRVSRNLASAPN